MLNLIKVFLLVIYQLVRHIVFNERLEKVEESIHVIFYETNRFVPSVDDDDVSPDIEDKMEDLHINDKKIESSQQIQEESKDVKNSDLPKEWKYAKSHPQDLIIGDTSKGITTRSALQQIANCAFISQIVPKKVDEALKDEYWIMSMQAELNQFKRNQVWELVPRPDGVMIIGTKWVFRNKENEEGKVVTNKSRIVAQGYIQEKGIDFEESFALVTRLETIRIMCAYACYKNFKLF